MLNYGLASLVISERYCARVPNSMRTSGHLAMVPDGMVKFLGLGIGKAQPTHPDGASPEDMSCYCLECDNNGQELNSAGGCAEQCFIALFFILHLAHRLTTVP